MPSARGLLNDSLNKGSSNVAPAMLWCDEHTGEPRRKLRANVHVMFDETGGAEQLVPSQRNERSGNLAMTAITFDPRSAILHCLAWPEVAPFGMKPASDYGYELTTISEVFDSYHGDCNPTRRKSGGKLSWQDCGTGQDSPGAG